MLLAGLFVAIAGGLADLSVLTRSQVPTTLPYDVARTTVAAALGLGVGLAVAGALRCPRGARRPSVGARDLVALDAVVALELQRRVTDPEAVGQHRLELVAARLRLVQGRLPREHHVRGQRRRLRSE